MLGTQHLAENEFSEMMKKSDDDLGLTSLFSNILSLQKTYWKLLPKDKNKNKTKQTNQPHTDTAHELAQKIRAPRTAGLLVDTTQMLSVRWRVGSIFNL